MRNHKQSQRLKKQVNLCRVNYLVAEITVYQLRTHNFYLKIEFIFECPPFQARHASSAIFELMEIWYNRKRLNTALEYQSPVQADENL